MTDNLPLHPQRYPEHDDPRKGQVLGGECNRTHCSRGGAVQFHGGTFGFYCRVCTDMFLNTPRSGHFFFNREGKTKPGLEEMARMHEIYMENFRSNC